MENKIKYFSEIDVKINYDCCYYIIDEYKKHVIIFSLIIIINNQMFFIAEIPPSTFITCPVMNEAESERRKAAASAISFASPILFKG